jgi:hypothetical protein
MSKTNSAVLVGKLRDTKLRKATGDLDVELRVLRVCSAESP